MDDTRSQASASSSVISQVVISGVALLKLIRHATKSQPNLSGGSLIGLDDGAGRLEVSDCFGFPAMAASSHEEGEDEAAAAGEQDVADHQQEMMRILRESNGDDNCVGWYRSVHMGDWCNADLVEQQFEHQDELDTAGIPRSVLIMYDPYQTSNGHLAIKAVRLTDAFVEIMRARASGDARVAASDLALAHVLISDIFYEIPIVIENSSLVKSYLHDLRPMLNLDTMGYEGLIVSVDPYLEKNVAFVVEELDRLQKEQLTAQNHQRALAKQKQMQTKFLAERKSENAARAARGQEPLPLKDLSDPAFRPLKDSSKLSSLLIRKQLDIYCEQINAFSASNFELEFLRSAVQPQ